MLESSPNTTPRTTKPHTATPLPSPPLPYPTILYPTAANRTVCLCWGLTSQSTIFQLCRDGATTSWVINQYFRRVKCLAQGHNTAAVGFEPRTSRSGVRHSTTGPPRSPSSHCTGFYLTMPYHTLAYPTIINKINIPPETFPTLIDHIY